MSNILYTGAGTSASNPVHVSEAGGGATEAMP